MNPPESKETQQGRTDYAYFRVHKGIIHFARFLQIYFQFLIRINILKVGKVVSTTF
jgi:hypothetical protein